MFNKVPKNNKPKMFKFNLYWMIRANFYDAYCSVSDERFLGIERIGMDRIPETGPG